MTMRSRLPDDLSDERSMREFMDRIDRSILKAGQVPNLGVAPSTSEIAATVNAILAALRTK